MDKEILFKSKRFNVTKRDSKTGIEMNVVTVGVLPYVISDGLLSSIGVLHEYNPYRKGKFTNTLISGTVDADDKDLLSCAIRELEEEGGFVQTDVDQWIFLGSFNISKASDEKLHVFAVNVTDLEQGKAKGDGSKGEELSELKMMQINDAILTDEALFLASFLRLFDFFYQKNADKK